MNTKAINIEDTLKLALEALTFSKSDSMAVEELIDDAIVALEEALAKQEVDSADSAAWRLGYDAGVARQEAIYESAKQEQELDPVHEYRKGFIAGQIDMRDRPEEQSVSVGEPVAYDGTATEGGARYQADQNLRALLRYTENFYGSAIKHGMKAGETANAIAHIEKAGKALHGLVHAWADVAEQRQTQPKQEQSKPAVIYDDPCPDCGKQLQVVRGGGVRCSCGYWFCF